MHEPDLTRAQPAFGFVVGCPRSGTTLLQAMLDSHPDLAVPPESHFIPRLERRFGSGWHGLARAERFADALFAGRRFQLWGISRDEVVELVGAQRPGSLAEAIRMLFAAWAGREGKTLYADKTPRYLGQIGRIATLLPEARFVHLIRDGRDVALSLAEAFERGPQTAAQGALYWSSRVAEGRRQGLALDPGRYLELRYEALVAEPEVALRELCEFIDLSFEGAMLTPERRAAAVAERYPDPTVHSNLARPPEARRDWRQAMSAAERRRFELVAGGQLAALDYPTETDLDGPAAEAERLALLAAEFEELRHSRFRANRKAARRAERLARQRRSRWSRLGRALARPLGLLHAATGRRGRG